MSASRAIIPVRDIVAKTTEYLSSKSICTARLDAELLIGAAIGMDRLKLFMNLDRPMDDEEIHRARDLVRRRALHEPVAYILGYREFCSRRFDVNPAVLIPRPETELLVEQAKSELGRRFPDIGTAYRILEFGAGSGAIGITLAIELPAARITATEISESAAATALHNAQKYGVGERVNIRVQADLAGLDGPFHAIVANPPYIDIFEMSRLQPDVVRFEPHVALFADQAGLEWYHFLTRHAACLLVPGGFLLLEIGHQQAQSLRQISAEHSWLLEAVTKDYSGLDRVVRLSRL